MPRSQAHQAAGRTPECAGEDLNRFFENTNSFRAKAAGVKASFGATPSKRQLALDFNRLVDESNEIVAVYKRTLAGCPLNARVQAELGDMTLDLYEVRLLLNR